MKPVDKHILSLSWAMEHSYQKVKEASTQSNSKGTKIIKKLGPAMEARIQAGD